MISRTSVNKSLCVVLMPFGLKEDREIFKTITASANRDELDIWRADKDPKDSARLMDQIWKKIWQARVVIADITGHNPNVLYELGICHALGVPVIIIRQEGTNIPFNISHIRIFTYNCKSADWKDQFGRMLTNCLGHEIEGGDSERILTWPSDAKMVDAGTTIRESRFKFSEVLTDSCSRIIMTGLNFGDQFGKRGEDKSYLYKKLIEMLERNKNLVVELYFAPPQMLEKANPVGYKQLIERSLPTMWDLHREAEDRHFVRRLKMRSHIGALSLTAFIRDPDCDESALITMNPRWVSDTRGPSRVYFALAKERDPEMFKTLWHEMKSNLDQDSGLSIVDTIDSLTSSRKLGSKYIDFIKNGGSEWKAR